MVYILYVLPFIYILDNYSNYSNFPSSRTNMPLINHGILQTALLSFNTTDIFRRFFFINFVTCAGDRSRHILVSSFNYTARYPVEACLENTDIANKRTVADMHASY